MYIYKPFFSVLSITWGMEKKNICMEVDTKNVKYCVNATKVPALIATHKNGAWVRNQVCKKKKNTT